MPAEQVQPEFELALIQANVATIAAQKTEAALASDPEPQVIAQDCAAGSCYNDQRNGQLMRGSRGNSRDEQHGFARKGNARALDGDEEQDRPIAVGGQETEQVGGCQLNHKTPLSRDLG